MRGVHGGAWAAETAPDLTSHVFCRVNRWREIRLPGCQPKSQHSQGGNYERAGARVRFSAVNRTKQETAGNMLRAEPPDPSRSPSNDIRAGVPQGHASSLAIPITRYTRHPVSLVSGEKRKRFQIMVEAPETMSAARCEGVERFGPSICCPGF